MLRCFFLTAVACFTLLSSSCSNDKLPETEEGDNGSGSVTPNDTTSARVDTFSIAFPDAVNDTLEVLTLSPTIRYEVRSDTGLTMVSTFAIKSDGSAAAIGAAVSSFTNAQLYERTLTGSDFTLTNDLVGIRVQAGERSGRSLRREVRLHLVSKPIISFSVDSLVVNTNPLASKPTPTYTIASSGLSKVSVYLVYSNGTEVKHGMDIISFPDGAYYGSIADVTYVESLIGLKVVAEDISGGKSEATLALRCFEDTNAAPIVQFLHSEAVAVYGSVNPLIRFQVTSGMGLRKLTYSYIRTNDDYMPLGEVTTFDNNKSYVGEITGLSKENFQYLKSVEVRAEDLGGKVATQELAIPKIAAMSETDLVAFHGAEGFGRNATGGRGGKVIYVTNLSDNNTQGSLRWAINQTGARTIVFKVSGNIVLSSRLSIKNGDVTIAGQTAPGDGICLSGYDVTVDASNVIVRYIRFRMGDLNKEVESDAFWGRYQKNVILDHCSMSWSVDECSSFYENEDFTMQWCILSESLRLSGHEKGAHGYGGIAGGRRASYHHNIMAHHDSRNPRFGAYTVTGNRAEGLVDYRNNVIYNWGGNSGYGGEGGSYNMVNNYYQPGVGSANVTRIVHPDPDATTGVHGVFYVAGNVMMNVDGSVNTSVTNDNWQGVHVNASIANPSAVKSTVEYDKGTVTTHTAERARELILAYGGASYKRDPIDTRVLKEARNREAPVRAYYTLNTAAFNALPSEVRGKGKTRAGMIDTQKDVGGWCELESLSAPLDTDGDGMPDAWETANGLNPNNANDGKVSTLSSGYTNLEVYLNSIVDHITREQQKQ